MRGNRKILFILAMLTAIQTNAADDWQKQGWSKATFLPAGNR